jgi:glucose-1-phosphate thymidylyltransferase
MKKMWAIIPAAGAGSRIQPLAFSKELLPVGSKNEGAFEKPRAVSEYLVDRMIAAGADKICFVISHGKSDIMEYYGYGIGSTVFCYTVQQNPTGLCDSIFCALPLLNPDESVIIGLPDTIWFPENALCDLPDDKLSFLLFPVEHPEFFDAVLMNDNNNVEKIVVKQENPGTNWIWGAIKMPVKILAELYDVWCDRNKSDEYLGTLINAWLRSGGKAKGFTKGHSYVDVGTINGYRKAIQLLYEKKSLAEDL